jgi:hypothetical protein
VWLLLATLVAGAVIGFVVRLVALLLIVGAVICGRRALGWGWDNENENNEDEANEEDTDD